MSSNSRPRPALASRSTCAPRPHPLALALACALTLPAAAQVLPTGASVVRGQASIVTQGNQMTVSTSNQTVLNWQSFSIGAGQAVRFDQPSESSKVLNRVLGRDPTRIIGHLSSNGEVWLVNPYGVMFGQGARVDVGGLVASTLNISDADFAARRFSLLGGASAGAVHNQGEIRTTLGGRVLLLGGSAGVRNEGLIEAPGGQVALAAGASVDLADSNSPHLAVRVTAPAGQAVNLGRILAAGGAIDLSAAMVNQDGVVRADRLAQGPGGEVRLTAGDTLSLGAGSVSSANGAQGGSVMLQGGTTLVAGTVQAVGDQGRGGDLRVLGAQVGLLDGSVIRADGGAGGGHIRVGGGEQGRDADLPNARAVYMAPGATVSADATVLGDGGRVVLWSDRATRAYGALSARGGPAGGDGGFIETSGGWLDARPASVRTDAPHGRPGQWLLDPNDIFITDASVPDTNISAGPNFNTTADAAIVTIATITAALEAGTSVSISTAAAAPDSEPGNITMEGTLSVEPPRAVTFTLNAHRLVTFNSASIHSAGPLSVTVSAGIGGTGNISVQNSTISVGGNITLGGPSPACGSAGCSSFPGAVATPEDGRSTGVDVVGSTLRASRISLRGVSALDDRGHIGVGIDSGSLVEGQQVDVAGWVGGTANSGQIGVDVSGTLAAVDRLTIEGVSHISGPGGGESSAIGVRIGPFGSLRVGPDAVNGGGEFASFNGAATGDRRALAVDPNRSLRVTGTSDVRAGLFTPSVDISGQVRVTDKAGVSLVGNGGDLLLRTGSFDVGAAGNLLTSGTGMLVVRTDDALLPNGEPVRLSNVPGVTIEGSMFGSPSEFVIDSPGGAVLIADSLLSPLISIGSSPFTSRSATFAIGTFGGSAQIDAGQVLIRANRIDIGPSASISASGLGDAIVLTGLAGNAATVIVDAEGDPLSVPNGRWLVYATDPTDGANFSAGPLHYDFTQYDARHPGTAVQGTGNGLLFSLAPEVLVTGGLAGPTSKTYDGTTQSTATLVEPSYTGLLPGDVILDPANIGALRYASADAGNPIPFVASIIGAPPPVFDQQERPVYGYRFSGRTSELSGSILARTLVLEGLGNFDKVYDATTAVPLHNVTLLGLVPGEQLTLLPGTVAFDTANAGRDKPVTGVLELADGPGGRASNYRLPAQARVDTTATIVPRPVTLAGVAVSDKVYDGSADATLTGGALTGLVGAQTLTLTTGAARFDTPDAGVGKSVTAALQLSDGSNGGLAANYDLTNGRALVLSGSILPRPVALTGFRVDDKVYDGTTLAPSTMGELVGVLPGEALTVALDARFADNRVGNAKPVNTAVVLGDTPSGRASNYVASGGGLTRASILPRPVTADGVFAADKPYDGTDAATLIAGTLSGLVPGETLTLSSGARFSSPAVGTARDVTGTVALADGSGLASNYVLTNGGAFRGRASISPRGLTVTGATAGFKVYDGNTAIGVSGFTLDGVLGGEQVAISGGIGRFDDPNVGTGKAVTATATGIVGLDAGNYTLVQASTRTTGSITPATLIYSADAVTSPAGYPLPRLTGAVTGFVSGDTLVNATTGQVRFGTEATQSSPVGSYGVTGSGLSAVNYSFAQAPGNASALSIVPLSTSQLAEPTSTAPGVPQLLAALLPPPVVSSIGAHRAADALPAMQFAPPNFVFQPFDLEGSSQDDVARMLAARDRYKKGIFAVAIRDLENNPGAADAPACQTVEQAVVGSCLITEALKPALRERVQVEFRRTSPAPPTSGPVIAATPQAAQAPQLAPTAPPVAAPVMPPAPAPAVTPQETAGIAALRPTPATQAQPTFRLPAMRAVRAAALPQIQTKWALLIGTDVYGDARIPQLDNAVSDVDAVAATLEGKLGYQTIVVRNGSKSAILRAFNQLAAAVAPSDSVAIYYAGHGELVEKIGLGFWQPSDADASRAETWISNTDIGKLLGQITASQIVLVSDSCFSGSLVSDERIRGRSASPDPAALLSRRAAVVMSSGGNEPVFDSGKNGHSTFAWSFMKALEGVSSWRPGGNVFEQVRFAVARQVPQRPQYGASRLGGHEPGADYVFEQRQLESAP